MEIKRSIIVRVLEKEKSHIDGTPLMLYKFTVINDPNQDGRAGEIIHKYYGKDPFLNVGKLYALNADLRITICDIGGE